MAKDEGSEGAAGKDTATGGGSEQTPEQQAEELAVVKKGLTELTEQLKGSSAQTKDLQGEVQRLKQKNELLEDEFVKGFATRSEGATPAGLDEGELSPEGAAIVKHLDDRFRDLESRFGSREAAVRKDLTAQSQAEVTAFALKRDNPELWELVGPKAVEIAKASGGTLDVQQSWDAAMEELKPYIDAKAAADAHVAEDAKKAGGEKPTPGGEPALTPEQVADKAYEDLGIDSKFSVESAGRIGKP